MCFEIPSYKQWSSPATLARLAFQNGGHFQETSKQESQLIGAHNLCFD